MSTKRVRWSTITIHEFGVGHGGSAVPKSGPSIGLARVPEFTWSTSVGMMARECDGVRRFSSAERIALLRDAGYSSETIDAFAVEAKDVRRSRELYYSSEMKSYRKKRKRSKADAKAAQKKQESEPIHVAVIMTAAIEEERHANESDEEEKPVRLRIDVTTADTKLTSLSPLLPQPLPLPLSPCCS